MYEVEVKVPADHGPVRDRLVELDADRVASVVQVDTYYDAPDRSFADTDEALRIRRERSGPDPEWAAMTYKGPKVDDSSQTREEFETEVGDGRAADSILRGLGYDPVAEVSKERERYAIEDVTVTLDDVEGVGSFVEVELETDESGVEPARKRAFEFVERLGLDPAESVRESYLELLLASR